ncbi:MAG: hypothetical protein FWC60_09930, partial [Firmicutes bacterium]|nr:hypothetical protein [Bacillota bacterium]
TGHGMQRYTVTGGHLGAYLHRAPGAGVSVHNNLQKGSPLLRKQVNCYCSVLFILKVNTARQAISRKRFLEEYERTVNSMFEVRGSRFETI